MLREYSYTALILRWLLLLLLSFSGFGSGSGPECIDCGSVMEADCIPHNINQTMTCGINATSCSYKQCAEMQSCHLAFINVRDSWTFHTYCYRQNVVEDKCHLERLDRTNFTFPPYNGITCQCNSARNCSFLDGPLVYIHSPFKTSLSNSVEPTRIQVSPTLQLVPTVTGLFVPAVSDPSCEGTGCPGIVAATVIPVLVVVVAVEVVALVAVLICVHYKKRLNVDEYGDSGNDLNLGMEECATSTPAADAAIEPIPLQPTPIECSLKQPLKHCTPTEPTLRLQQLHQELSDKKMLFSRDEVKLVKVIGQGESGLVYRGYLDSRMGSELVAIKTGKALSSASDKEKLLKEMTTMLSFKHPNVMSLTGLCFDGEMPLLIMPFMSSGNILECVKQKKKELHLSRNAEKDEIVTARRLCLDMCHQISKGMKYLAMNKFVHRDLAARNCMIDQRGVIKVADFGLTEDTYGTNYYRRGKSETGSEEKVPIRWMAPESIENDIYNESTDVWAFGVTCWEIFTCGRVPYAGIPSMTLLRELRTGHRLDRPSNAACSDEIWDVVVSCWFVRSQQRPKFTNLVNELSELLDRDTSYLKLSQIVM